MYWVSSGIALLVAVAIIAIGAMYLFNPRGATQSFGLPLPEEGANVEWRLRLKGVRDIVSGLVLITLLPLGTQHLIGIILLILALIPAGDMSLILAAKGSKSRAFGIHGVTSVLMIVAGVLMVSGIA